MNCGPGRKWPAEWVAAVGQLAGQNKRALTWTICQIATAIALARLSISGPAGNKVRVFTTPFTSWKGGEQGEN